MNGLSFLSETIRVERIRDEEAYEGLRILLEARLGNVRIPLQIDVGFGDAIVPAPEQVEFPTLLNFPAPQLHAYPKESAVAEKFEALVKLGMANSRTPLPNSLPLAFSTDFHRLANKQTQWAAFLRRSGLSANSSLEETIRIIGVHGKAGMESATIRELAHNPMAPLANRGGVAVVYLGNREETLRE